MECLQDNCLFYFLYWTSVGLENHQLFLFQLWTDLWRMEFWMAQVKNISAFQYLAPKIKNVAKDWRKTNNIAFYATEFQAFSDFDSFSIFTLAPGSPFKPLTFSLNWSTRYLCIIRCLDLSYTTMQYTGKYIASLLFLFRLLGVKIADGASSDARPVCGLFNLLDMLVGNSISNCTGCEWLKGGLLSEEA